MLDAAAKQVSSHQPEKARYTQMHRENFRWDYKARRSPQRRGNEKTNL